MKWLLISAVLCAACSFLVTRDADGELMLSFFLFGLLGVIYWKVLLRFRKRLGFSDRLNLLLVSMISTIVGYLIDTHLDGMAGTLYFLLPTMIVAAFIVGEIILLLLKAVSLRSRDLDEDVHSTEISDPE